MEDKTTGYPLADKKPEPVFQSRGAILIHAERIEQVKKHGYSEDHDKGNSGDELRLAAIAILHRQEVYWPKWWSRDVFAHILEKPYEEQLVIAGALLAAEVDRKLYEKELTKQTVNAEKKG